MDLLTAQNLLAALSGIAVGFSLGLIGGGGSILAVPAMVYLVGVRNPHVAIGTSALAVAINALTSLASHARVANVEWKCGGAFAGAGIIGALAGSALGKAVNGQRLLFLFALLMVVVAVMMWRRRAVDGGDEAAHCHRQNMPKVLVFGFGAGTLSGFFGIGGGFLVVPALIAATGMPIYRAIGTSLVAVSAFGLTTAMSYAASGMLDGEIATWFVIGGLGGSFIGAAASRRLSTDRSRLTAIFSGAIMLVAFYMLWRSWSALS